jgi:hypothetical protein
MKEKSTITVEDHQPKTIGRMRLVRAGVNYRDYG